MSAPLDLAALPPEQRSTELQEYLHRAQANDAYWHGLFGGLYLPHLRRAVLAAEDDRFYLHLGFDFEEIEKANGGPLPDSMMVDLAVRMSPGMAAKVRIDEHLKPHLRGLTRGELAWLDVLLTHMDNIDVARAASYLGSSILGSGRNFELEVRKGAGSYVCGEASALVESLEGKRGTPRNRPPFPVTNGYLDQPVAAVGQITTSAQAEKILQGGGVEVIAIARASLRDPYWPLRAAAELDVEVDYWPTQYLRGKWPKA